MEQYPKVSIVTPSFNQGCYLEDTIQSVLGQDYPNFEYIVIDAGSKDNSVEIIQKYAGRLAHWVSEKDKGHADGVNKGFSFATGEILAWINSDDTYTPGAVSEAVEYMKAHPAVGMVYADANVIDHDSRVIGKFPAKQTSYQRMLQGSVHIPQATTFWRADLWRQVGPLDNSFFYAFDYNLWVKLAKVSEIAYIPRVWANFRIHADSKTVKNDDMCYKDMLQIVERETGRKNTTMRLRWTIRRLFYAWLPVRVKVWLRKALTF